MKATNAKPISAGVLALACLSVAAGANAATATGTLSVSAAVLSTCVIGNGTLAFGTYDPTLATPLTAAGTLTLVCTPGTSYQIGLNAGNSTGATTTTRQMTGASGPLPYKLFRDTANTQNWGNTPAVDTLNGTSDKTSVVNTIPVYGLIPARSPASIGAYVDVVTVTVTY